MSTRKKDLKAAIERLQCTVANMRTVVNTLGEMSIQRDEVLGAVERRFV